MATFNRVNSSDERMANSTRLPCTGTVVVVVALLAGGAVGTRAQAAVDLTAILDTYYQAATTRR